MAYKSQELAFHLTPAGWSTRRCSPSLRVDSLAAQRIPVILLVEEQRAWSRIWSEAELESLRQSFPAPVSLNQSNPVQSS
jgi:hypothetical protein